MEQKTKSQMRVFLSSTFVDMQKERDYLVKKIFPSIKAECRRRGVDFVALDLRWGINEETARSGKVVEICMDEIVRSRPFFIGLIGGRYGWIPQEGDEAITEKLLIKYPWIKGCVKDGLSITEMEMQFGVLNNPEPINAYFFQKDEIAIPGKFREKRGSEHAQKLSRLKSAVKEAADAGKCTLNSYSSMKSLGRQVYDALMEKIEELYPEEQNSRYAMYSRRQHEFLDSLRTVYVRYDRIPDLSGSVLVTGPEGIGKSALVANYADTVLKKGGYLVYTVINSEVNTAEMCRRMLLYELSLQFPGIDISVLDQPMDVTVDIVKAAKDAGFDGDVLWVIDGIDKLSVPEERSATWLKGDSDIILTTSHPSDINPGVLAGFKQVEVSPLKPGEIIEITKTYLKGFAKALSGAQESHISNSPLLKNPETLKVFLEELLQFGIHEKLGEFIDGYLSQKTVSGFYSKVLERFDHDFGAKRMRTLFGCLIMCAYGIPEEPLVRMLKINNVEWVAIYTAILPFISVSGGYMTLDDASMSSAAESHYDIRSMRRQKGMVNRLARILRKENRAMVKAADRRLIKEDGLFSYFQSKVFDAFSAVYRFSHMYFTPVDEIHYGGNDSSIFVMYVRAGRLRKAMSVAKGGALYGLIGNGISGLEALAALFKDSRNHVSEFIGIGDSLLMYLDAGLSVNSIVIPLLNAIEDPVRREEEKRRVIRKIKRMPMPSDGRKHLLSVSNDEDGFSDLESLLSKETFDTDDIMNIGKRILEVFIIHSEKRLKEIASVASDTAGRLDEGDPIWNLCHLVLGAVYMRLDKPDSDKYITEGVGNGFNVENLRAFFDEYELFKAVKYKDDDALENMMVRTVSYREKGIYGFLATYFRVRFVQCAALDGDEKEKRFKELADEFARALAPWGNLWSTFECEGDRLYNMGLYDIAGRLYERAALVCDASNVDALVMLWRYVGLSAQKDGNVQKAAEAFKRGLDLRKDYGLFEDLENLYRTSFNPREALFWARQLVGHLKEEGESDMVAGAYNCLGVDAMSAMSDKGLSLEDRLSCFKESYEAFMEAASLLEESRSRTIVANRAGLVFKSVPVIGEPAECLVDEHVRILEKLLVIPDDSGHRVDYISSTLASGYILQMNWRGLKMLRDEYGLKGEVIDKCSYRILYNCSEDKEKVLSEIAEEFTYATFNARTATFDTYLKLIAHYSDRWDEIEQMGILNPLLEKILGKAVQGDADSVPYAYTVKAIGDLVEDPDLVKHGLDYVCNAINNDPLAFRHYDTLCTLMFFKEELLARGWTQKDIDYRVAGEKIRNVCIERNLADIPVAVSAIFKTDQVLNLMTELICGVLDAGNEDACWSCLYEVETYMDEIVAALDYAEDKGMPEEVLDRFLKSVENLHDFCLNVINEFDEYRVNTLMTVMVRLYLPCAPVVVWLKMVERLNENDESAVMELWESHPDCRSNIWCQSSYVKALRLLKRYGEAESLAVSFIAEAETEEASLPLVQELMFILRNTGRYEEAYSMVERYGSISSDWDFHWLKEILSAYTGKPAEALLMCEKKWDGSDASIYAKALYLLKMGLYDDAMAAASEGSVGDDDEDVDWMYVLYLIELARYWKNAGDIPKAKGFLARARGHMDKVHMGMCEYEAAQLGLD